MKTKNIILTLIITLCTGGMLQAAETPRLLIQPFGYSGPPDTNWVSYGISDSMTTQYIRQGLNIINDDDRRRALAEISFGQTGAVDDTTAAKAGRLTGANLIISGNTQVAGDRVRVTARLIEVSSARTLAAEQVDGTVKELFTLQDELCRKMLALASAQRAYSWPALNLPASNPAPSAPAADNTAYTLYARALQLQTTDPSGALGLLRQAIGIDANYYEALYKAGSISYNRSLARDALDYLGRAQRVLDSQRKQQTVDYALTLNLLGLSYSLLNDSRNSMNCYRQALDIMQKLNLGDSDTSLNITNNIGVLYSTMGDYPRAIDHYNRVNTIRAQKGLEKTEVFAQTLSSTGVAYFYLGRYQEALQIYARADAIFKELNLTNRNSYAINLSNIGVTLWKTGELDRALEYYNQVIAIRRQLKMDRTDDFAITLTNVGTLYHSKKDYERALQYYGQAAEIREQLGLNKTELFAGTLSNMGVAYHMMGRTQEARDYYLRSKAIRDSLGLQNTINYATLMMNLGNLYMDYIKDPCSAAIFYETCYKIRLQNRHPETQETAEALRRAQQGCAAR